VRGYPQSYLSQLTVKNGQRPELGAASLGDVPVRVARNVRDRAAFLMVLLTHVRAEWFWPLVPGLAILVLWGLGASLWRGVGAWSAWYFLIHEALYLLWPWDFEDRFFLPVAPLACLYLWRGAKMAVGAASRHPRVAGACGILVGVPLTVSGALAIWDARGIRAIPGAIVWAALAMTSAWTIMANLRQSPPRWPRWLSPSTALASGSSKRAVVWTLSAAVLLGSVVGIGVIRESSAARENLAFDVRRENTYPDVEAGQWIRAHTQATAVVMARQLDVIYHYGQRRVVWFPPLRDPQELMNGIRRYGVEFVVVSDREVSYWLPPEQDCFEALVQAYPGQFGLVHQEPRLKIFQVSGNL